jgi:L-threonylcarbamoyladenylate synthase
MSSDVKMTEVRYASDDNVVYAVTVLKAGGVVAFPTDTVYGLGVTPWNQEAVMRLYEAKQRTSDKPIALLLSDVDYLTRVATPPPQLQPILTRLFNRFWPGGLTVVLPKTELVSDLISQGPTVAVRIPDLPLARALIRAAGGILAVTSANISGRLSPITAQEVEAQLQGRIDLILDGGPAPGGVPSTVLDGAAYPPRLLRYGAITVEALQAAIGPVIVGEAGKKGEMR